MINGKIVEELVILFCSNYWQNPQIASAVHYFNYKSHHHYQCHHFHCHCKIHLHCLRILLTIPLNCNMIPRLFPLNFVCFLPKCIFLQSYSRLYTFLRPVKGLRIRLRPSDIFSNFSLFILIFISIIIYTFLFTLILIYTYLH